MRNQKGITLIALVITIIVLLILAGVSIAMLTGENGILNKATSSRSATNEAEAVERINLALNAVKAEIFDQQVDEQNWEPITNDTTFNPSPAVDGKGPIEASLELDGIEEATTYTSATDASASGHYVYDLTGGILTISYFNSTTEVGVDSDGNPDPIEGTINLGDAPYTVTEAKGNS